MTAMHDLILVAGFVVTYVLLVAFQRSIMGQTDDLRAAIAQVGTDLGEAVARVEAKINELGEPDPDLSADIAQLREFSAQLDSLASDEPPTDTPPAP